VYKSLTPKANNKSKKGGKNRSQIITPIDVQSRPHSTLSSRSNYSFNKTDSNFNKESRDCLDLKRDP